MSLKKKKYLEIYPMEVAAKKINNLLDAMLEHKPNMYAKTRERYRSLAKLLLVCVDKISRLLQEDMLDTKNETDEFEELNAEPVDISDTENSMVISEQLNHVAEVLESIRSFNSKNVEKANKISTVVHRSSDTDLGGSNRSPNDIIATNTDNSEQQTSESDDDKCYQFQTNAKFEELLAEAESCNLGYTEVNECVFFLHKWFKTRFIDHRGYQKNEFHCKSKLIPEFTRDFILHFGKCMEQGGLQEFKNNVLTWCNKVTSKSKYVVPGDLYHIKESKYTIKDYTLSAVVLYDILYKNFLHKMGPAEYPNGCYNFDVHLMANTVKSHNSELLQLIKFRTGRTEEYAEQLNFVKA